MQTIIIIEGVTLTATQSTIDAYKAELAEMEREHREAEQLHELWLMLQTMERSDPLYSDLYKDVYGVRPPLVSGGGAGSPLEKTEVN